MIILSLTTIPERINYVYLTIESLMRQSCKPDKIILWLSDSKENRIKISKNLKRLKDRGLEIKWTSDTGPLKKSINVLKDFPNDLLITADDDFFYPKNWLKELYNAYLREPEYIHCHWAQYMVRNEKNILLPKDNWKSLWELYQGPSKELFLYPGSGCLFPPNTLSNEVFNEDRYNQLCPMQDDIWLTIMALLKGTLIKRVKNYPINLIPVLGTQSSGLKYNNIKLKDAQISKVLNYYGLLNPSILSPVT
jgi:hypothetical protein